MIKVVPYRSTWGNIKMRGKKHCVLSCRCCTISNYKEDQLLKAADKEAKANFDSKTNHVNDMLRYDLISEIDFEDVAYDEYWYQYKKAA